MNQGGEANHHTGWELEEGACINGIYAETGLWTWARSAEGASDGSWKQEAERAVVGFVQMPHLSIC